MKKNCEAAFFIDVHYSYSDIFCSQKMLICLLWIMFSSIPHIGQVLHSFKTCTVAEFGGTWILSSNSTVLLTQQLILSRKSKTKSLHLPYSKWTIWGTLLCTPLSSFPPFWIMLIFPNVVRFLLKSQNFHWKQEALVPTACDSFCTKLTGFSHSSPPC